MRRQLQAVGYVPLSRRRRRRRQSFVIALATAGGLMTAGLAFWLGPFGGEGEAADDSCVLVLVADRSSSSDDAGFAAQRTSEAHDILDENSGCRELIVSEIREFYGQAKVEVLPLQKESDIWVERMKHETKALKRAHETLDEVFLGIPKGRTNAIATLDELQNQVTAVAADGTSVRVYFWWDGIQSVAPLNMRLLFNGPTDPYEALERLPRIPDCEGWDISFVGVNRTAKAPLPPKVATKAEDFWYAYVERCGGKLLRYGPTLSSEERPNL